MVGLHLFSGQTTGIVEHQNNFAEGVLRKYPVSNGSVVFDIGSNDGTLLKAFKDRDCAVFGLIQLTRLLL